MKQGRAFLIGLAAGGILLAAPLLLLHNGSDPIVGPTTPSGSRGAVTDDVAALHREIDRLRGELRQAGNPLQRSVVEATVPVTAVGATADAIEPIAAPPHAQADLLMAELEELMRSDAPRKWLQNEPSEFVSFLMQQWIVAGHPERALALLQRVDTQGELDGYAFWVGEELFESGDRAAATQAYLMAMREAPQNWEVLNRLIAVAPDAALQTRDALGAEWDGNADIRGQNAVLLLATGRREEAMAAIDALLAEGVLPDSVWEHLIERDPAAAEIRLRNQVKSGGAEDSAGRLRLAAALRKLGRQDDARAEIEGLLREQPDDYVVIGALAELDRGRALTWLEDRLQSSPTPETWGMYAEQLLEAKRNDEAVGAFWQAWELAPDDGYGYRLLELAPRRVIPRLLDQAAANNDDELFGEVADTMWRMGRRNEARGYWERALSIDPTDSEWIEKLRAVSAGRDPMQ